MTFDLILRGGHVLDPANERDGVMDVAISADRIVRVASEIRDAARQTLDVTGLYVVPGLIDTLKDPLAREGALEVLGTLGCAARAAVPALLALISEVEPAEQLLLVTALGHIGRSAQSAVPVLLRNYDRRMVSKNDLCHDRSLSNAFCRAFGFCLFSIQ